MSHLAQGHAERMVADLVGSPVTEEAQQAFAKSFTKTIREVGCTLSNREIPESAFGLDLLGYMAPGDIKPDEHTQAAITALLTRIPLNSVLVANSDEQNEFEALIKMEIDLIWRLRLGIVKSRSTNWLDQAYRAR